MRIGDLPDVCNAVGVENFPIGGALINPKSTEFPLVFFAKLSLHTYLRHHGILLIGECPLRSRFVFWVRDALQTRGLRKRRCIPTAVANGLFRLVFPSEVSKEV